MSAELGILATFALTLLGIARWFAVHVVARLGAIERRLARLQERRGIADSEAPPAELELEDVGGPPPRAPRLSMFKLGRRSPPEK